MKVFSFVIWLLWAAIVARALLAPFWSLTTGQAMLLLLVAAPGVGGLALIGSLLRRAGGGELVAAGNPGRS